MRILLLDDDPRRRKAFRRAAPPGAEVDAALDADEAIRLLRDRPYDRVYLDFDLDADPTARALDDYASGQAVADYLAAHAAEHRACRFIIHSRNPAGAAAMRATLRAAGLHTSVERWSW